MPVYSCPECKTRLQRTEPLPAGKKLRCPECGTVFAPPRAAAKPAVKKAEPAKAEVDDKVFGFHASEQNPDHDSAREDVFTPIKDRFARSARGPALIHVVKPSDWLLRTGALICAAALLGVLWAIWPLVFKTEDVQPVDTKSKQAKFIPAFGQERRFKELTDEEFQMRFVYLGIFVGQFLWGAVVCAGASKMHTLEMYPLAMIASVMVAVGPGVPAGIILLITAIKDEEPYYTFVAILLLTLPGIPMAMWGLATLRRQEVLDGFAEETPEEYIGDKAMG